MLDCVEISYITSADSSHLYTKAGPKFEQSMIELIKQRFIMVMHKVTKRYIVHL